FMNFSEFTGPRQTIFMAESDDLVHWTRLGDEYEFVQDDRWYKPMWRWDCIWAIDRPGGGLYGYWTATPKEETGGRFGFGESLDGKTWTKVTPPVARAAEGRPLSATAAMTRPWLAPGELDLTMGRYDKAGVLGRYGFYLRARIATGLKKLTVNEIVVHNRCAQPHLMPGRNEITVTLADPEVLKTSRLLVTYVYAEGTKKPGAKPRHPFDGRGYQWGKDKTVRKEVTKTPYRFTIDVAGDTPPRMKSLTRELLPR
ncbi:hypothetical protein LCGC14_0993180, partial [marine sediment metagenome]